LQAEFDRALYPRPIARTQLLSFLGVASLQDSMKVLRTTSFTNSGQALPEFLVGGRAEEERLTKGLQIETRATHQQHPVAARFDLFDCFGCRARPVRRGEVYLRRYKVNQVMWHAAPVLDRHLGSRDLGVLINLNMVAIDDLQVQAMSQL